MRNRNGKKGLKALSQIAFWGAVELGLVYSFVALGVYLA
ncbi:ABC transporter permease, partial [Rhizobium hidalgonense]